MSTLRDKVIGEYISKNYPDARIMNHNDEDCDLVFYSAEQLQNVDEDWFPLCCYKDPVDGHAIYGGRKKVIHTYTEGETGAGKTTRFVMQSILALSSMKVKPSFVIVDIHGEIIENLYNHLKQNGYKIRILNCDEPKRSDTYNPFAELAQECLKKRTISDSAINRIRKIAEIIQPVESDKDPIWDQGARSYTNGCILDKFEDLINGDIPTECLSIYNVIQNHFWLREKMTLNTDLFKIPHYRKKGSKTLSAQKMVAVTNNAERTRASYYGVIENHYDDFGQPSMYSLSSSSTIDISDFVDEPTVIVIQSGSTKIGDDLISLLMNEIYTYVVNKGKEYKTKKLPRNIHCFLDEFANCNIADGPEYIKMLTTSRKFGMYWHMILQCDAQLDRKFDANIGRIIRANSTEIFMGSHDYETEVRFAKSCGQKTIESLSSELVRQDPRLEVVDLITPEQLNLTEEGYVYIKSNRHPLMKSYIEAFYKCDEFVPVDDISTVYPYNTFDYQQTAFYPDDVPPVVSALGYDILLFLRKGNKSLRQVLDQFPGERTKQAIKELAMKGVVDLLGDRLIQCNVTKRQFDMYNYKKANGFTTNNPFAFASESLGDRRKAREIDEWISRQEHVEPEMVTELRNHLADRSLSDVLKLVEDLTIVPEFVKETLRELHMPVEHDPSELDIDLWPDNPNNLKIDIIEGYISGNDYLLKMEWERHMQEEYEVLVKASVFPESILRLFKESVDELQKEMTLKNIREIKRILKDNEE